MPKVGNKKFPYTEAGKRAAKKAKAMKAKAPARMKAAKKATKRGKR